MVEWRRRHAGMADWTLAGGGDWRVVAGWRRPIGDWRRDWRVANRYWRRLEGGGLAADWRGDWGRRLVTGGDWRVAADWLGNWRCGRRWRAGGCALADDGELATLVSDDFASNERMRRRKENETDGSSGCQRLTRVTRVRVVSQRPKRRRISRSVRAG
ncbi:unnamed protein product [Linum trigynum]|uniref:Uncharacterized protein n=1 Tax=Linum trigynum TaxID=586398 RepID=A0AAV2F434_9ROSI